jgi:hypothetical protein
LPGQARTPAVNSINKTPIETARKQRSIRFLRSCNRGLVITSAAVALRA